MDEFFNPKSLITPAAAGLATMLIANTLAWQFGFSPKYTALSVSLLIALVLISTTRHLITWQRFAFYTLNALVIFTVAIGINETALHGIRGYEAATNGIAQSEVTKDHRRFVSDWFTSDVERYVEEWLNHDLDDDEFRDLLLGAKDLNRLEHITQQGLRQIERDRRVIKIRQFMIVVGIIIAIGAIFFGWRIRTREMRRREK
jgi:hypothetical protein